MAAGIAERAWDYQFVDSKGRARKWKVAPYVFAHTPRRFSVSTAAFAVPALLGDGCRSGSEDERD